MLKIGSPGRGWRGYWHVYPTGSWEPQWDPTGPPRPMYWKSNNDFCLSQLSSEATPSNICSNMRRSCSANINMAGVGTPVQTGAKADESCDGQVVGVSWLWVEVSPAWTVAANQYFIVWLHLRAGLLASFSSYVKWQRLPVRNWWALGVWTPQPTSVSQSVAVLLPQSKHEHLTVQQPESDNVLTL